MAATPGAFAGGGRRINNPDDHCDVITFPIQWTFMYTDTPEGRVVQEDAKHKTRHTDSRAQKKLFETRQIEAEPTVRLHPKLPGVRKVMAAVLILVAHRLGGPFSLRPLSPRPCKAAAPKGPTFCFLNYSQWLCSCWIQAWNALHRSHSNEEITSFRDKCLR